MSWGARRVDEDATGLKFRGRGPGDEGRSHMATSSCKEKYMKSSGAHCPFCESRNITSGPIQADGPVAWAEVECEVCGASWQDVWALPARIEPLPAAGLALEPDHERRGEWPQAEPFQGRQPRPARGQDAEGAS